MRYDDLVKISEMAALHGVSRQTLILYDRNGLLKPAHVSENGYRYYSVDQIPRLRQICLLKEMGVPLARIREHLDRCSTDSMANLLRDRAAQINDEARRLDRQRDQISQLAEIFETVATRERNADVPFVHWKPARKAIFAPYPSTEMDPKQLHLTLMDAWGSLLDAGEIPSKGFGSLLRVESLRGERPLEGAGSIVFLPREVAVEGCEVVDLPEGEYVCMYKHAMPYDVEPAQRLLAWMDERGLVPAGSVVDRCLLDAVFYNDRRTTDFCQLEVPLG